MRANLGKPAGSLASRREVWSRRGQPSRRGVRSSFADDSTWCGEGVRREVFFFRSDDDLLYGSLYGSLPIRHRFGLLICSSWGIDADRLQRVIPKLATGMALTGGVAMTFHFPGFGDSPGSSESGTMEDLGRSALAALREARSRYPSTTWMTAGLVMGASVAAVASRGDGVHHLLLLQPELDPYSYVRTVKHKATHRHLGAGDTDHSAFGYPIPEGLLDPGSTSLVNDSLACFEGRGAVIHYSESPIPEAVPDGFDVVPVDGEWRIGRRGGCPELIDAALSLVKQVIESETESVRGI